MSKTKQAVQWILEQPGRTPADAGRKFGIAPNNISVALRLARSRQAAQRTGPCCALCGQPTPAAPAPIAPSGPNTELAYLISERNARLGLSQPIPDIDPATGCAPDFIPVTPAPVRTMAPGFVPVINPEVARFLAERDAAIRARDAAEAAKLPVIPDEHAAARTVWDIKPE